jgi:PAS domain S-box-containing protein
MRQSLRSLAPAKCLCRRVDHLLADNRKLRSQLASSTGLLPLADLVHAEHQERVVARLEQIGKIYSSAHIGLCVFDRYLRYAHVNECLAEINGVPVTEHIGRTLREIVPEVAPKAEAVAKEIFETGRPVLNVEFQLPADDHPGPTRSWISQWLPLMDADGQVSAINVVVEDVTEQKAAEERVRQSERMLYAALDNTPDVLIIYDRDRRVEFINSSALKRSGRPIHDFLGKRDEEIWPEEITRCYVPCLDSCLTEKQTVEFEMTMAFRPETPVRTLAVVLVPLLDVKGDVYQVLSISRDVTDRKHAEQELEQLVTERTIQLEELASQLHGRNAQLQAMALELTQAEQRERRQLAQILHDHLQQLLVGAKFTLGAMKGHHHRGPALKTELEQLEALLNEAIETSRSLTCDLSPPILYQCGLADALEWLAGEMKRKHGLQVKTRIESRIKVRSEAVRVLLFTAARELLFNVVKHAKVDNATLTVQRKKHRIRITVADRGAGFDPNQIRARGGPSEGFGLFSIEERLCLIGGEILIQSKPGEGSSFTLVAPCLESGIPEDEVEPAATGAHRHPRPAAAPGSSIRVILADDHGIMRTGLATLLGEQPDICVVAQASNGQEAIDLCRAHKPHVLVLDVAMPVMDGVQACQIISREMPGVRIVALSMFDSSDLARPMLAAGADAYLTKSGPPNLLLGAIRKCAH